MIAIVGSGKQALLARAGLASFAEPKQILDELDRALHAQYVKTNMNLVEGNNSWVKFNKDDTLTISTPKAEDADAPLQTFFPEQDYISLLEVSYVIDGLMRNDVVKSDVHSTDTHGYSEMIIGTMHLLGFSYAPRIKNPKRQRLYTFKSRRGWDRAQVKVAPSGYIDTQIIEDNWGRYSPIHCDHQTQGDDCLGDLPATQLLLQTTCPLPSAEDLRQDC